MGEPKVDPVKLMAVAAAGTALPTTISGSLSAYTDVGEISEDSLVEALNTASTTIKNARGTIVRTVQSEFNPTFQITPLEENKATLLLYYSGSTLAPSGAGSKLSMAPIASGDRRVIVIDTLDGTKVTRYVLPNCEVTDRGNRDHKDNDAAKFPLTITAYADANGFHAYIYYPDDYTSA